MLENIKITKNNKITTRNLDDLHVEVSHINPIYTHLVDFTSLDKFYRIEAAADEQKKDH